MNLLRNISGSQATLALLLASNPAGAAAFGQTGLLDEGGKFMMEL